jgi:hypothetical protein
MVLSPTLAALEVVGIGVFPGYLLGFEEATA